MFFGRSTLAVEVGNSACICSGAPGVVALAPGLPLVLHIGHMRGDTVVFHSTQSRHSKNPEIAHSEQDAKADRI